MPKITVPGPDMVMPPGPSHGALSVIVRVASGAKVTMPEPGKLVRFMVGILAALQVQLVPPERMEPSPSWPPVFGPRFTVRKVPPEMLMTLIEAATLLATTPPFPIKLVPPLTLRVAVPALLALPNEIVEQ